MADQKISQLSAASPLVGTEIVPIVQSGGNVKTTVQDIADLASGGTGTVETVVAGTNISVNSTDPANPVVSVTGLTSDHGSLSGLSDDDHTQYHNDSRGDARYPAKTVTITGATSLTGGGDLTANRTIALVNDSATPGNSKYYGTDGSGTKGFFSLPAGGGGVESIVAGTGISVDNTDPSNPVVSSTGGGGSNSPRVYAIQASATAVASSTWTKLALNTADGTTGSVPTFIEGTSAVLNSNGTFKPGETGKYFVIYYARTTSIASTKEIAGRVMRYPNSDGSGTGVFQGGYVESFSAGETSTTITGFAVVNITSTSQTIGIEVQHSDTGSKNFVGGNTGGYLSIIKLA